MKINPSKLPIPLAMTVIVGGLGLRQIGYITHDTFIIVVIAAVAIALVFNLVIFRKR